MDKTVSQIIMDFASVKKQAQRLETTASNLRKLANKNLQGNLEDINAVWTGDSANLFLRKGDNLKSQILKVAKQLEDTASSIRKIADNTYKSEMEAVRIAQERSATKGK